MVGSSSFIKFLGVGGTAFLLHTALLYLLVQRLGFWETPAYAGAFLLSLTFTWMSNRWLTFRVQTGPTWGDYLRYARGMLLGATLNLITFTVIVSFIPPMPLRLFIGTAGGTLVGLVWNYRFMRKMWDSTSLL